MPEISVVVPVYKAEAYISRCIDSILSQTFSDFELILVDDGSPDRSGAICDEYARKDPRIQVIHKQNGGVSSARNAGLDVAQGKWITFVDSDDYVLETFLEDLYDIRFDVIITGHVIVNADSQSYYYQKLQSSSHTNIDSETIEMLLKRNGNTWLYLMTSHLFKKSIIKDHNIRFQEGINYREDSLFMVDYFIHCDSVSLKDKCNYVYMRRNHGSLSTAYNISFLQAYCKTDNIIAKKMSKRYNMEFSQFSIEEKCAMHVSCLGECVSDNTITLWDKYQVFRYLFTNQYFRLALHDPLKYFPNTSFAYRTLLRFNSPFIMLIALSCAIKLKRG